MKRARGFTLLEVLIALAILALSAAAVLRQTQLGVKQQRELELKTYAMWVADDVLSNVIAQDQWPPLGRSERTASYREQDWRIVTEVQTTPDPTLRKIVVSVNLAALASTSNSSNSALATFTTYRGQY